MFKSIQKIFNNQISPAEDQADDARRLQVATCALLLEAAYADRDFSAEERDKVTALVAGRFQLREAEATELIAAADEERQAQEDLYQFARLVNESFTRPRKLAIIELLWEVVYSDKVLEAHEDALMHKMANLLGVRHEELIALKLKVKRSKE